MASANIARRAGVISSSYRTANGRYILSEHDLRSVRFSMTPEEYVTGLDVELVSEEVSKTLIREGGYQIGEPVVPKVEQPEPVAPVTNEAAKATEPENQDEVQDEVQDGTAVAEETAAEELSDNERRDDDE